jgi:L-ascorbate metabolism protein UlaG (beta-lactamase superfamily)
MSFGKIRFLLICIPLLLLAQACSNSGNSASSTPSGANTPVQNAVSESPQSSEVSPEPSSSSAQPAIEYDTDTLKNTTGKTIIHSITPSSDGALHASYAIISKSGTVVIADPYQIEKKDGKVLHADIITVSHGHPDHNDDAFIQDSSEAHISITKEESFTVKDIKVISIAASHTDEFNPDFPSDYIYVFEVDGLRIAHFGDMGQTELNTEQLKKLGKIDILLTRFSNATQYSASTDKTIKVLEQVKPIITSPTHYELDIVQEIITKLKLTDKGEAKELVVDRADLDAIKGTEYYLLKY